MLLITVIMATFQTVMSLSCYSCYVRPPPRAPGSNDSTPSRLCSQFNGSSHYAVDCPYSTFCLTRTFSLKHGQGSEGFVTIVERGCALQAYTYQDLVRGKWETITTIQEEVYSTGCFTDHWAGNLATNTEYCYCDTPLCNSATKLLPLWLLGVAILLLYNAL